jgi:ankyrin repeat protein
MVHLFSACSWGLEALKKYLKEGHGINDKDEYGDTALHHCSEYGVIDAVEYLISNGAKIDILDAFGRTPLILGISAREHFRVTQLLLKAGANPNIKDESGITALGVIQKSNDEVRKKDTTDLLKKSGAKHNVGPETRYSRDGTIIEDDETF